MVPTFPIHHKLFIKHPSCSRHYSRGWGFNGLKKKKKKKTDNIKVITKVTKLTVLDVFR